MSYVANIKKLLADDLKGLITHVTGYNDGSPDFKKCEDTSWSFIVDHYYPSVHDLKVKSTLYEFVDKFKVHGFPQKAKNLKLLIETYSELDYFKKYCVVGIQWGLIDFLIKLSFKPTSSLEDDLPLNLKDKSGKEDESFDWGTYLKEGNEKFRLPSEDEESWSEEEETQERAAIVPDHVNPFQPALVTAQAEPSAYELRLEALQRAEAAADWLEVHTQNMWWKNPTFREIPQSKRPEANYCFIWEKMRTGTHSDDTRILSEYKVTMELIYMLASPSSCYFIREISKDCFKPIQSVSLCSISPKLFSCVIEENFCEYLPCIKKLDTFCSEMETDFLSPIPITFRAYGSSLKKILCTYKEKLEIIEREVDSQGSTTTLRYLLKDISPWLSRLLYLYRVHESAIPQEYTEADCRRNALILLSVLYNELKHSTKWRVGDIAWQKNIILGLLIDTLEPFLSMLGSHLAGKHHQHSASEFFLCNSGRILVDDYPNGSDEFWKPVLQMASAAVISSNFLSKLGRDSSFFMRNCPTDVMYSEIVKKLFTILKLTETHSAVMEDADSEYKQKENLFPSDVREMLFHSGSLLDNVFRKVIEPRPKLIKPTASDSLMEALSAVDLSSSTVHIYLKEAVKSVIEDYMEPKGFAADILLDQFNLLQHLNALYTVVQLTSALSAILITESSIKTSTNSKNVKISRSLERFKNCLLGVLPPDYVNNFIFRFDISLYKKNTSILDKSDFFHLSYQANQEIRLIISEERINNYTEIFRYMLKIRIALDSIKRLAKDFIEETSENCLRFRQLCSLRMWLIHIMSTLNHYFTTYSDSKFQTKIRELCLKERNLSAVYEAHAEFLEKWKYHCFIQEGHPCLKNIEELILICNQLTVYWKMAKKNFLADYHLEQIEKRYFDCVTDFVGNIQLFEDRLVDKNDTFEFFYDEIMNNVPTPHLVNSSDSSLLLE